MLSQQQMALETWSEARVHGFLLNKAMQCRVS